MEWFPAPHIKKEIEEITRKLSFSHVNRERIICFESHGSTSKANARIWSLPRPWQLALNIKPHYIIEVLGERFNKLSRKDQKKILIHELLHIPKNFSGALRPHRGRYGWRLEKMVEELFTQTL